MFPRIPLPWYQRLKDPWEFYENIKKTVWDVRWLIGYIEELEHKAQLAPDPLSKRIRDALSDLADTMCIVCNTEISDYTPKNAVDREKDLKNLQFLPRNNPKTVPDDTETNDARRHENMMKIVKNSRKRRKKAGV